MVRHSEQINEVSPRILQVFTIAYWRAVKSLKVYKFKKLPFYLREIHNQGKLFTQVIQIQNSFSLLIYRRFSRIE
jgi:hypothetical protein